MKAKTKLEARVIAANRANKLANELHGRLTKVLAPLVGKSVLKMDGSLLAKYDKLVAEALNTEDKQVFSIYRSRSTYSLVWTVKTVESFEGCAYYHESSAYIGELDGGILTKLSDPPNLRTDYDASVIKQAREDYKQAEKIASDLKGKLFPFDEYDR